MKLQFVVLGFCQGVRGIICAIASYVPVREVFASMKRMCRNRGYEFAAV